MKKIAIIIQNLNGGGAERTAANLSLYFSEKYEVHLIVFDGRVISYIVYEVLQNPNGQISLVKGNRLLILKKYQILE